MTNNHRRPEYYAHSHPNFPQDKTKWHKLEDHLKATAELAREFAGPFRSKNWVYLAGLWRDVAGQQEGC